MKRLQDRLNLNRALARRRRRLVIGPFYPHHFSNLRSWRLEAMGRPLLVHQMRQRLGLSHLVSRRRRFIDLMHYRRLK